MADYPNCKLCGALSHSEHLVAGECVMCTRKTMKAIRILVKKLEAAVVRLRDTKMVEGSKFVIRDARAYDDLIALLPAQCGEGPGSGPAPSPNARAALTPRPRNQGPGGKSG